MDGIVAVGIHAQAVAETCLRREQLIGRVPHVADESRVDVMVLAKHIREREIAPLRGPQRVEGVNAAVTRGVARWPLAPANDRQMRQRFLLPPGDVRDDVADGPLFP